VPRLELQTLTKACRGSLDEAGEKGPYSLRHFSARLYMSKSEGVEKDWPGL